MDRMQHTQEPSTAAWLFAGLWKCVCFLFEPFMSPEEIDGEEEFSFEIYCHEGCP